MPDITCSGIGGYAKKFAYCATSLLAACRGNAIPGRSRYLFVPAITAIQGGWLIPEGMSRLWRLGMRGRRRGLVPGGERGGGRVSVTGNCHSSSSGRLCRAYSWAGRKTRARFTLPRPLPPPVVISRDHIALLLRGSSVFVREGSAAHPDDWLPATRPPTHTSDSEFVSDNTLSLELGPLVTVRCHSG